MFAVIETGGKQIKAIPGQYINVEKLPQKDGEKVSFKDVLILVMPKEGGVLEPRLLGKPFIEGACVNGQIVKTAKDKKVIVYKMRPKKGTRKKYGHRQFYSRIFIESIELDGKTILKAEKNKPEKGKS